MKGRERGRELLGSKLPMGPDMERDGEREIRGPERVLPICSLASLLLQLRTGRGHRFIDITTLILILNLSGASPHITTLILILKQHFKAEAVVKIFAVELRREKPQGNSKG